MSRQCGWCGHLKRAELEKRILDGESIRVVAADAGYSESAAARHMRNHVQTALLGELRSGTASMHLADFGVRLVELVNETAVVRQHAHDSNDPRLLLQAIAHERDTLGVLIGKLGIDAAEVLEVVGEAKALANACSWVLVAHPSICGEMASKLHELGVTDLAESFEWLREKGQRQQLDNPTEKEQLA